MWKFSNSNVSVFRTPLSIPHLNNSEKYILFLSAEKHLQSIPTLEFPMTIRIFFNSFIIHLLSELYIIKSTQNNCFEQGGYQQIANNRKLFPTKKINVLTIASPNLQMNKKTINLAIDQYKTTNSVFLPLFPENTVLSPSTTLLLPDNDKSYFHEIHSSFRQVFPSLT